MNSVGLLKLSHICITATALVNVINGLFDITYDWFRFAKTSI